MKKFADTVRRLLSIVLNLFIVWAEPIALPMSWDWGKEQMFIFYTEDSNILSACICAMVAVGQLVCIFTVRELPRWQNTLKYIATCCLTMTFLTVVFVLGPMYEDGNGWYIMLCTSSMLYITCSARWRPSSPLCCWSAHRACHAVRSSGRCCPRCCMAASFCG